MPRSRCCRARSTIDDLVGARRRRSPSRAAENLFWFGRYGERCDGTARCCASRSARRARRSASTRRRRRRRRRSLAQRLGLIDTTATTRHGGLLRAATHPRRRARRAPAPAVARRLQPARSHVGRPLAHAQPAARRPGVPAAPTPSAAARAGLARSRSDLDDDAVGLRARRHDARHRLALPVDGPARRAPVDDVRRAAGRDPTTAARTGSTGCSISPTRASPTARATWSRRSGCRCSTCWCATRPTRARSPSRPRAWPNTSPSSRQTHGRFAQRRARARRTPRCARSAAPTCIPRATIARRLLDAAAARRARGLGRALAEVLLARRLAQRAVARRMRHSRDRPHAVRYRVEHETRYAYRAPVSQSWQLAHLTPRDAALAAAAPPRAADRARAPDERHDETDSFGNTVTTSASAGAHRAAARAHGLRGRGARDAADGPTAPRCDRCEAVRIGAARRAARRTTSRRRACASRRRSCPGRKRRAPTRCRSLAAGRDWLDAVSRPDAPHPRRLRVRARRDDGRRPRSTRCSRRAAASARTSRT